MSLRDAYAISKGNTILNFQTHHLSAVFFSFPSINQDIFSVIGLFLYVSSWIFGTIVRDFLGIKKTI